MPVKISKVAKDLNVGTSTIIEFLSKKNITRCCSMRSVPTRTSA